MNLDQLIEVTLDEPNAFLKVKETLTRIGIAAKDQNILYQSCHILHKQGRYFITHFKEMFALDGKKAAITENDIARRNSIANLIAEWGLVKLVDKEKSASPVAPMSQIKILAYRDKDKYTLVPKYNIGRKVKRDEN